MSRFKGTILQKTESYRTKGFVKKDARFRVILTLLLKSFTEGELFGPAHYWRGACGGAVGSGIAGSIEFSMT
jgi:hypothetical protein